MRARVGAGGTLTGWTMGGGGRKFVPEATGRAMAGTEKGAVLFSGVYREQRRNKGSQARCDRAGNDRDGGWSTRFYHRRLWRRKGSRSGRAILPRRG